ncbi:helix-turn-helix domain-containing protein [Williamsia muralis]|uniref:Helix-turn-helix domain-containing protein n=1 Tax=Williamsia marianensis TaxID=85044 RepID=A0ABU4F2N5_WILMA|nr:helix-turn-helix domain-containing protein [Williamsia muralis]MDV7137174.1 helix-turn-helix domain-containing protein [Williamsia muralis]
MPTPRLHTVEETAELLHISRAHVFTLVNRGELTSVKVGRRRLISERAITEYVDRLETAHAPLPKHTRANPFVAS